MKFFFMYTATVALYLIYPQLNAGMIENDFVDQLQIEKEKIYTSPENIYVAPTGIYLYLENDFIQVEQVAADSVGIYVTLLDKVEPVNVWYCHYCKKHNWSFAERCPRCGRLEKDCKK